MTPALARLHEIRRVIMSQSGVSAIRCTRCRGRTTRSSAAAADGESGPPGAASALRDVPPEMRGLGRDRAEMAVLVPQTGGPGGVAVADVPRLDLLQDPGRGGRSHEADA